MMCFGIIYCVFMLVVVTEVMDLWGLLFNTFESLLALVILSSNIFGVSFWDFSYLYVKPLDNVTKTYVVLFIYLKYFSLSELQFGSFLLLFSSSIDVYRQHPVCS